MGTLARAYWFIRPEDPVLPAMTSRDWGRIVMVASVTGPEMAMRADGGAS
jgi:hypothetical protein